MKVKELIAVLSEIDGERDVVVWDARIGEWIDVNSEDVAEWECPAILRDGGSCSADVVSIGL